MRKFKKVKCVLLALFIFATSILSVSAKTYNNNTDTEEMVVDLISDSISIKNDEISEDVNNQYEKTNRNKKVNIDINNFKSINGYTSNNNIALIVESDFYINSDEEVKSRIKTFFNDAFKNKKKVVFYGDKDTLNIGQIYETLNINMPFKLEIDDAKQQESLVAISAQLDEKGEVHIVMNYDSRTGSLDDYDKISSIISEFDNWGYSNNYESPVSDISTQSLNIDPISYTGNDYSYEDISISNCLTARNIYYFKRVNIGESSTKWELKCSCEANSIGNWNTDAVTIMFWPNEGEVKGQIFPTTTLAEGSSGFSFDVSSDGSVSSGYSYSENWSDLTVATSIIDNEIDSEMWVFDYKRKSVSAENQAITEAGALYYNYSGALDINVYTCYDMWRDDILFFYATDSTSRNYHITLNDIIS